MSKEAKAEQRQVDEPPHRVDGVSGFDEADQSLSHAQEHGRTEDHGEQGQEVGCRIERHLLDGRGRQQDYHCHHQHRDELDGQPADHNRPGRSRRDPQALKDALLPIPSDGRRIPQDGNGRDTEGDGRRDPEERVAELNPPLAGELRIQQNERREQGQREGAPIAQLNREVGPKEGRQYSRQRRNARRWSDRRATHLNRGARCPSIR